MSSRMMYRLGFVVVFAVCGVDAAAQTPAQPERAAQRRVRERVAVLLRDRVGLTEVQLRQLAPIHQRFEMRRQSLFRAERSARQSLRRELSAPDPDQARVSAHIDTLLGLQRQRIDLAAEEQRELATFMTPVQRARYLALQDLLRRRSEEFRRRRSEARRGPPRGGL